MPQSPATPENHPLLDPFAFASETRGRFRMLLAAALVMALNLGFLVNGFIAPPSRGQVSEVRRVWDEILRGRTIYDLEPREMRELGRPLPPLVRAQLRSRLRDLTALPWPSSPSPGWRPRSISAIRGESGDATTPVLSRRSGLQGWFPNSGSTRTASVRSRCRGLRPAEDLPPSFR